VFIIKQSEQACKPSSVVESNHLSSGAIADAVMPPVGNSAEQAGPASSGTVNSDSCAGIPRSVLLRIGFTGRGGSPRAGELLPRLSILTSMPNERAPNGWLAVYFCCTFPKVALGGR